MVKWLFLIGMILVAVLCVNPAYADSGEFNTSTSDGFLSSWGTVYLTTRNATEAVSAVNMWYVNYNPSVLYVGQEHNTYYGADLYIIGRSYLYFDTSSIPDGASITNASIRMRGAIQNIDKDFSVFIQNGMPTYPHDPLVKQDLDYARYSGWGGSKNTSGISNNQWVVLPLNAVGRGWVNTEGYTKLMLRSSRDLNMTIPLLGDLERAAFSSANALGGKYSPQLRVEWAASGPPEVTTRTPHYITVSSARLRGLLDWDGGESCNCSFYYYESGTWPGGLIPIWVTSPSTHTGEAFTHDLTSLKWGTSYFAYAYCFNSQGIGNSSGLSFTTSSALGDPSDLSLIPETCSINLSWVKGSGASNTIVRYQTGDCPLTNSSGEVAYNDSSTYFRHTDLEPGTTYYYNLWSYGKGNFSPNGSGCQWITTLAGSCEEDYPSTGNVPGGWFAAPDYTKMEGFPGYGIINNIADTMSMPYGTMWLLLTMAVITISGFFIYSRTHHLMIAAVFILVGTILGSIIGLLPLWMAFIFGIGASGLAWKELR